MSTNRPPPGQGRSFTFHDEEKPDDGAAWPPTAQQAPLTKEQKLEIGNRKFRQLLGEKSLPKMIPPQVQERAASAAYKGTPPINHHRVGNRSTARQHQLDAKPVETGSHEAETQIISHAPDTRIFYYQGVDFEPSPKEATSSKNTHRQRGLQAVESFENVVEIPDGPVGQEEVQPQGSPWAVVRVNTNPSERSWISTGDFENQTTFETTPKDWSLEKTGDDASWSNGSEKKSIPRELFLPYMHAWRDEVAEDVGKGVKVDWRNIPLHWQCDIDAEEGIWLDPLIAPETMRDDSKVDPEYLDRQNNLTSNLAASQRFNTHCLTKQRVNTGSNTPRDSPNIQRLSICNVAKLNQSPRQKHPVELTVPQAGMIGRAPSPQPYSHQGLTPYNSLHPENRKLGRTPLPYREPVPHPYAPKVECHLRPARPADLPGACEIYNLEVASGTQALDVVLLSHKDFMEIWQRCQEDNLQFIVAISGPAEPVRQGRQQEAAKVISFGFYSIYQPGLNGSSNGTSRFSIKANVFVHPRFRRKGLGRAVLDKLMLLTTPFHHAKEGYEFVNPGDNPLYRNRDSCPRKYHRIFVEVRFKGKDDPTKEWFEEFLVRTFGFWVVSEPKRGLENCHRSRPNHDPTWSDVCIYMRDCKTEKEFNDKD